MTVPVVDDIWYRYVDVAYAGVSDEFGEPGASSLSVRLDEYRVVKVTAKCAWLVSNGDFAVLRHGAWSDDARRILLSARKQFACPTKETAIVSFLARKRKQLSIYEARARRAREAIRIATSAVWQGFDTKHRDNATTT